MFSVTKQVRDWYVESFKELRQFPNIKDSADEIKFTDLLRSIYRRHANVVPVMAKGVAELRRELLEQNCITELPEIHQFLDGFYLSRIGIRILIGRRVGMDRVLPAMCHSAHGQLALSVSCKVVHSGLQLL